MTCIGQLARDLFAEQADDGHFRAVRISGDARHDDDNGFATALVLRELYLSGQAQRYRTQIGRALDYLESCADPAHPGAYGFWPRQRWPEWARHVPADADDTAVMLLAMLVHGRLSLPRVIAHAATLFPLLKLQRVSPPAPAWLRPGMWVTWIGEFDKPNPVDCCVNAHIVGLLSACGLHDLDGYAQACAGLNAAVQWAGDDAVRADTLCPFYATPVELAHAVDAACRLGADELRPLHKRLQTLGWAVGGAAGALFRDAYGHRSWRSNAVMLARRLRVHAVTTGDAVAVA